MGVVCAPKGGCSPVTKGPRNPATVTSRSTRKFPVHIPLYRRKRGNALAGVVAYFLSEALVGVVAYSLSDALVGVVAYSLSDALLGVVAYYPLSDALVGVVAHEELSVSPET